MTSSANVDKRAVRLHWTYLYYAHEICLLLNKSEGKKKTFLKDMFNAEKIGRETRMMKWVV